MQNNFVDFIDNNYQADLGNYLKDALVIFDTYNVNDHEFPLQNIMYGTSNQLDYSETLDRFVDTIKGYLLTLSDNFGITFIEDVDLNDLTTAFKTLIDIEHYLDHDQILRAIESDNVPLETLSNIFEIVSNLPSSWTFSKLIGINEDLLVSIKNTHYSKALGLETVTEETTVEQQYQIQIDNLKLYKEFIETDQLVCFKLIRRGVPIGLDFKSNVDYIKNHLEYAKLEDLVKELLGILYLSKDTYTNPVLSLRSNSDYLFDDLKKITQVDSEVANLVSNFLAFKTTRK